VAHGDLLQPDRTAPRSSQLFYTAVTRTDEVSGTRKAAVTRADTIVGTLSPLWPYEWIFVVEAAGRTTVLEGGLSARHDEGVLAWRPVR
jgi:hypothetical protein